MLINKILNIKYPIFQGAMANIADAQFAADVANAGGLGVIATGSMTPDKAREEILKCFSLTDKPFGVNLMLMNPYSAQIVDVLCELKPAIVTTGAGNPRQNMAKLYEAGIKVFPIVPTGALARRMELYGADGIIAEGTEAGGHVGEMTTMTLIPQVVDAVNLPVIAAGGIADSRGVVAAIALGALGVQVGTSLLASTECPIHENYKLAVVKAKDSDTIVTGRSVKAPVRCFKNAMTQHYVKLEEEKASKEELEKLTMGSLRKAVVEGDSKNGSLMMGQIAGLVKEIKPLKEIFEDMVSGTTPLLDELYENFR